MTLNAPKGRGAKRRAPLGAFSVTKTALKCQKNVLKMPGGIFVDIFLTFSEGSRERHLGPLQNVHLTFFGTFRGVPESTSRDPL